VRVVVLERLAAASMAIRRWFTPALDDGSMVRSEQ
jgi:hypothetical protein